MRLPAPTVTCITQFAILAQVFVKKTDLPNAVIPVHGLFPDLPWIDRNALGSQYTPLSLNDSAVISSPPLTAGSPPSQLAANWRTQAIIITNGEAQRRILEGFSDYMQRNAIDDLTKSMTLMAIRMYPVRQPTRRRGTTKAFVVGITFPRCARRRTPCQPRGRPTQPTTATGPPSSRHRSTFRPCDHAVVTSL